MSNGRGSAVPLVDMEPSCAAACVALAYVTEIIDIDALFSYDIGEDCTAWGCCVVDR
jgi:hypothetical protein